MRSPRHVYLALFFASIWAAPQGTPPPVDLAEPLEPVHIGLAGTPPIPPGTPLERLSRAVKSGVKKETRRAFSASAPAINQWRPLTVEGKFHVFVVHTYSPRTFVSAGVDAATDKMINDSNQYETGFAGACQRYGVELAISETDVFFGRFLLPTLLRQDPRYFRNPNLTFWKRTLYAVSRVVITRSDGGHDTFNASHVLGGAASQALSDLYAPGQRQGLHPIVSRVTIHLAADGGINLLHEFWPDLRRRFFHH